MTAGQPPETASNGIGPADPDALYEAGRDHMMAGRYLDAQVCCQQALSIDSNHPDALQLMGLLSFQTAQYDLALEWIARAIRRNPKLEYLSNFGHILRRVGRNDEALQVFDKAVQLAPDDAESWTNLGKTLVDLGRPTDALLSFQHALKLRPHHREAIGLSGDLLYQLKRLEDARHHFDLSVELQPDDTSMLAKRARVLVDMERFEQALADYRRLHALDPRNADTCSNVGHVLAQLGRHAEALEWFDKGLELRPQFGTALSNKATSLGNLRRFDEALEVYDHLISLDPNDSSAAMGKAMLLFQLHRFQEASEIYHQLISRDPNNVMAEIGLGHLDLTIGNFAAGWAGHEARLKVPHRSSYFQKFSQPMWSGKEPIAGKTILVYADEGLGDSIQFARYIPMLAARGARVILVVQEGALALLSGIAGASQCLPKSTDQFPVFDFHCSMSSLPLAFETRLGTIPRGAMYLAPPAESRKKLWEDRLGSHDKLRVGLVWSGNPKHKNDLNRSLPLRSLTRILDTDATFVSLQKDPRPDDRAVLLERTDIVDMTEHLTDLAETAALVSCLDLVVTVDTSVAHLAAALGCPTWILLPYTPDWRWLLDREDSPWYPTVRLFRQSENRDYGIVLDRVRAEMRSLIRKIAVIEL